MKWTAVRDAIDATTWRVECDGHLLCIEVPADEFSALMLEHVVREALGMPLAPAP